MIIIDFSQVFLSNLMAQTKQHADSVDPNLVRHMILNGIRNYKKKFGSKYGDIVIACDGKQCWRKQSFPYYKAHRKTARDKSTLDWVKILNLLDTIRDEISNNFPYPVIHVDHAEADDIIAVLVERYSSKEHIMILSGDSDFIQLQQYKNVTQYDPIRKRSLKSEDPKKDLYEKILKGDRGDGIPNILSADNVYVKKIRSTPLRKTVLNEFLEDPNLYINPSAVFEEESRQQNFFRNQRLIDLSLIPETIKKSISNEINLQLKNSGDRSKMYNYMVKKKMKHLMAQINDF